jgi:hypothetical protein
VPYWRGRRLLAALDALAWPAVLLVAIRTAPFSTAAVGLVASSLAVMVAARRLHRAILRNQRYEFTTLRWGIVLAWMLAIGAGLKLLS